MVKPDTAAFGQRGLQCQPKHLPEGRDLLVALQAELALVAGPSDPLDTDYNQVSVAR